MRRTPAVGATLGKQGPAKSRPSRRIRLVTGAAVLAMLVLPLPTSASVGRATLIAPANSGLAAPASPARDTSGDKVHVMATRSVGCDSSASGIVGANAPLNLCVPFSNLPSEVPSAPPSSSTADACLTLPELDDKCEAWSVSYNSSDEAYGGGWHSSRMMKTSPDGRLVYIAGVTDGDASSAVDYDYLLIAYEAATGQQVWEARFAGVAGFANAEAHGLALSADGKAIFVTGKTCKTAFLTCVVATVAYEAATGKAIWPDAAVLSAEEMVYQSSIAVSPDGRQVYVVGQHLDKDGTLLGSTNAYEAATGALLWRSFHIPEGGANSVSVDVALSPDGQKVYVAGGKLSERGRTEDLVLLVYDATDGSLRGEAHHPTYGDAPTGMAVSGDGSRVAVTHMNLNKETGNYSALTVAYDSEGREIWSKKFRGCEESGCAARPWYYGPLAISHDGSSIYMTVQGMQPHTSLSSRRTDFSFTTVAFDGSTGTQKWLARYPSAFIECLCGPTLDLSPNERDVYVTGGISPGAGWRTATLAYDAATGRQKWSAVYADGYYTEANSIVVSPDGARVFVGGTMLHTTKSPGPGPDLFVAAYDTQEA